MHQKKFDWTEPTLVFDFLDRYREALAHLQVAEDEAFLFLWIASRPSQVAL